MRHIGLHLNWGQKVDPLYEWRPPVVVTANLSPELAVFKRESPSTILVARGFPDDRLNPNFNEPFPVKDRARADTAAAFARVARTRPDVLQVTNEPVLDKSPDIQRDALKRQAEYDAECARLANVYGVRVSFGNWAWGTPEVEHMDAYYDGFDAAVEYGCPVLLHEYDLPDVDKAWSLYRHRQWWQQLPSRLQRDMRIILGETGPHWWGSVPGWLANDMPPEEYIAWCVRYDHEIHQDEYVLGTALFAKAEYDTRWWSFDTTPVERDLICLSTPIYRPLPEPAGSRPLVGRDFPGEDLRGTLPVHESRHYGARSLDKVDKTIIHHSAMRPKATDSAYIREHIAAIASYHVRRGWPGIGYHALVGLEGDAYLVNSLRTSSYHAGRQNAKSFGVCMLGRFDEGWDMPTAAQVGKVNEICAWLGRPVYPHSRFAQTRCPGRCREMAITWA